MTIDDWLTLIVRSLPGAAMVYRKKNKIKVMVFGHRVLITIEQGK